jgi:hypothetical protein
MFVDPSAINSFWMTRLINHDVAVLIQPSTTSIVLTFKWRALYLWTQSRLQSFCGCFAVGTEYTRAPH